VTIWCRSGEEVTRVLNTVAVNLIVVDVDTYPPADQDALTSLSLPTIFLISNEEQGSALQQVTSGDGDSQAVTVLKKPLSLLLLEQVLLKGNAERRVRDEIVAGPFYLKPDEHRFRCEKGDVELTPTEFRLVHYLMIHQGEVVSANELLERVWGFHPGTGSPDIIRAHVSNIRRKLRTAGLLETCIETLPRRGYRFVAK